MGRLGASKDYVGAEQGRLHRYGNHWAAITIWNATASFIAHTLLKELVKALQHYLQATREGGGRE